MLRYRSSVSSKIRYSQIAVVDDAVAVDAVHQCVKQYLPNVLLIICTRNQIFDMIYTRMHRIWLFFIWMGMSARNEMKWRKKGKELD
jgi:hypothetical protein